MKKVLLVAVILILAVAVGGFYFWQQNNLRNINLNQATGIIGNSNQVFTGEQSPGENTSSETSPPETPTSESHDIQISGFSFSPLTIAINAGDAVVWTNADSAAHTVTSDSGSEISSSTLSKGATYSHVFTTAGTYKYHCGFHSSMKGTIVVQ